MISETEKQKMIGLLGQEGHRLTPQKKAVIEILFAHDKENMTVEKIYEYTRSQYTHISIATVYKTISALERKGLLQKIRIDDKCSYYELICPDKPPWCPHCVCTECGKMIEIMDDSIIHILDICKQTIKTHYNFRIDIQNILYYGVCKECRAKS